MAEPEALALLRQTVDGFLRKSSDDVRVDHDGDFEVQRNGVATWVQVRSLGPDQTAVLVWSAVNVGMTIDAALTEYLAGEGNNLAFGQFELHEGPPRIHISHALLGEFLSREELEVAVEAVAEASAHYGPLVKERFGGSLPSEFVAPAVPEQPPVATPGPVPAPTVDRTKVIRAGFGLLGLTAGVVTAVYAYEQTSSWLLVAYAFIAVANVIARALSHLVTDPDKLARALYYLVPPAVGTGMLFVTYAVSSRWWLAVLLACVGWVVARGVTNAALPRIAAEGLPS